MLFINADTLQKTIIYYMVLCLNVSNSTYFYHFHAPKNCFGEYIVFFLSIIMSETNNFMSLYWNKTEGNGRYREREEP